jgi:hypothetical protein
VPDLEQRGVNRSVDPAGGQELVMERQKRTRLRRRDGKIASAKVEPNYTPMRMPS